MVCLSFCVVHAVVRRTGTFIHAKLLVLCSLKRLQEYPQHGVVSGGYSQIARVTVTKLGRIKQPTTTGVCGHCAGPLHPSAAPSLGPVDHAAAAVWRSPHSRATNPRSSTPPPIRATVPHPCDQRPPHADAATATSRPRRRTGRDPPPHGRGVAADPPDLPHLRRHYRRHRAACDVRVNGRNAKRRPPLMRRRPRRQGGGGGSGAFTPAPSGTGGAAPASLRQGAPATAAATTAAAAVLLLGHLWV